MWDIVSRGVQESEGACASVGDEKKEVQNGPQAEQEREQRTVYQAPPLDYGVMRFVNQPQEQEERDIVRCKPKLWKPVVQVEQSDQDPVFLECIPQQL